MWTTQPPLLIALSLLSSFVVPAFDRFTRP